MDLTAGRIRVKNWFDFLNPKDYAEGKWEVKADGRTVGSGVLPELDIQPGEEREYKLALPKMQCDSRRRVLAEHQIRAEIRHDVGCEGTRDRAGISSSCR